ncbi:MAG: 4Fe-4S dicluster domain-containing protein [Candidatus Sigynarchaeota archaeon]
MPKLLTKRKKVLFFQKNRCQGCEMCVVVCPTGVLELSDEYNMRAAQIPKIKAGKEKSCILCQRCEFACPNWAIYVIDEQPVEKTPAGEVAKV